MGLVTWSPSPTAVSSISDCPSPHGSKVAAGCLRVWTRCKGDGIRFDVIWSICSKVWLLRKLESKNHSLLHQNFTHEAAWHWWPRLSRPPMQCSLHGPCLVCPMQGGWLAHLPKHAVVVDPWQPPRDWIRADQQPDLVQQLDDFWASYKMMVFWVSNQILFLYPCGSTYIFQIDIIAVSSTDAIYFWVLMCFHATPTLHGQPWSEQKAGRLKGLLLQWYQDCPITWRGSKYMLTKCKCSLSLIIALPNHMLTSTLDLQGYTYIYIYVYIYMCNIYIYIHIMYVYIYITWFEATTILKRISRPMFN